MSLEEAFQTYIDLIQAVIASSKRNAVPTGAIKHTTYDELNLRSLVEDLESQTEFNNLINETALNFSKEPYKSHSLEYICWRQNVETFFRRSGFYLSAYKGEIQGNAIRQYVEAFEQDTGLKRYLVPLEFVDFGGDQIDFGSFRIVQLYQDDLEALLQTEINHLFFPYAYADLSKLAGLWFLEVVETADAWKPGSCGLIEMRGPEVGLTFTDFPPKVEYALKLLALYDWGTYQSPFPVPVKEQQELKKLKKFVKELDTDWDRFHVPFIISINENQLWNPDALPDLSVVSTQPDSVEEGEEFERPVISIFVETDQFREVMQGISKQMSEVEDRLATQWPFFDMALGYLVKAFFASGLDQFLWHMVVVESLLGDKGDSADGLTKRLRRRGSYVVAQNKQESSNIKNLVENLYTLRSDMVHGNTEILNSKVYLGHLREARDLARRVSLWFLERLSNLNKSSERMNAGKLPTRKEIIAAIDVLSEDKVDASNVKFALDVLPIVRTDQSSAL